MEIVDEMTVRSKLGEPVFNQLMEEISTGRKSLKHLARGIGGPVEKFFDEKSKSKLDTSEMFKEMLTLWDEEWLNYSEGEAKDKLYDIISDDEPTKRIMKTEIDELRSRCGTTPNTNDGKSPRASFKPFNISYERESWEKEHILDVETTEREESCRRLETMNEELQICCYKRTFTIGDNTTEEFMDFFIKDPITNLAIIFSEDGEEAGRFLLKIDDLKLVDDEGSVIMYEEQETFSTNSKTLERIRSVLGARNWSLLLRNSEHFMTYIQTGIWTSKQVMENHFLIHCLNPPHENIKKLINIRPKELENTFDEHRILHPQMNPTISDSQIGKCDDKTAYNVLFLGPTGVGKSTIINLLFNREVCRVGESTEPQTRDVQITSGLYQRKGKVQKVNIVDSPGFCDGLISDDVHLTYVRSVVQTELAHINKVVIVFTSKCTLGQQHTIRRWISDFNISLTNFENFTFIMSKCDEGSDYFTSLESTMKMLTDNKTKTAVSLQMRDLDKGYSHQLKEQVSKLGDALFSEPSNSVKLDFMPEVLELSSWENEHVLVSRKIEKSRIKEITDQRNVSIFSKNLHLCSVWDDKMGNSRYYFITDRKNSLKMTQHRFTKEQSLRIIPQESDSYSIESTFYLEEDVKHRMKMLVDRVLNFSYVFRNSEHVCRYIMTGVWISFQTTAKGTLRNIFRKYLDKEKDKRRLLNVPPEDLVTEKEVLPQIFNGEDFSNVHLGIGSTCIKAIKSITNSLR